MFVSLLWKTKVSWIRTNTFSGSVLAEEPEYSINVLVLFLMVKFKCDSFAVLYCCYASKKLTALFMFYVRIDSHRSCTER